jgi:hypothetical protein
MQRLAQDTTEVAELQDKVTRVWVATIMAVALAARAERMAQEKAVEPASAHGEANKAAEGLLFRW